MKTFIVSHETWYAKASKIFLPEINIVETHSEGGCAFEFNIVWKNIGVGLFPKLEMFDDSWAAFREYPELFKQLASWESIVPPQPENIIQILKDLGFEDVTERKNPKEDTSIVQEY